MKHRARLLLSTSLVLAVVACQGKAPSASAPRPTRAPLAGTVAASPSPKASLPLASQAPGLPPAANLRAIASGSAVLLSGAVKLLSNHGSGVISNNSGNLLSDQGSGLVANNGGGLVSNNGGALVSNNSAGRRLLQQNAAAPESLLAEAEVRLLDATGQALAGPDGQALVARTDAQGNYKLAAILPAGEPVVASVRLFNGGELRAMVVAPEGGATAAQSPIDTASSLGAAYVLDKLVQKQVARFKKLPAAEAEALHREAEAARARLGSRLPSYQNDELLRLAEELKGQDPSFSARLDKIEALLLAGQAALGEGLPADQVALTTPTAAYPLPDGGGMVMELLQARVRRIGADGKLRLAKPEGAVKPLTATMVAPDASGGFWVADKGGAGLFHLDAAFSRWERKAGTGASKQGAVGGLATTVDLLRPSAVAALPGGGALVAEFVLSNHPADGRLLQVGADGSLKAIEAPPALNGARQRVPMGMAVMADGSWVVLWRMLGDVKTARPDGTKVKIRTHAYRRSAAGVWDSQPYAELLGETVGPTKLLPEANGSVLFVDPRTNQVLRLKADGQKEVVAGTGVPGGDGDGGLALQAQLNGPVDVAPTGDGGYWIADAGNGRVRRMGADGRISSLAGALGAVQAGDALALSMNGPGPMVAEPDGALLVAESYSGLIRRLQNGKLSPFAGRGAGDDGDNGPALQARFLNPYGLARRADGAVAVCDSDACRVRLIRPDGVVVAYAGVGGKEDERKEVVPAKDLGLGGPAGLAWGLDGRLAIADRSNRQVWEISPDGLTARRVAGDFNKPQALTLKGDAPASGTALGAPVAVAYDAQGQLLIADLMLGQILRLEGGKLKAWAGMGLSPKALAGGAEPDGSATSEVALWGPGSLLFGPDGSLYVGEFGTQLVSGVGGIDGFELPAGLPTVFPRVRRISPEGKVYTLAGQGGKALTDVEGDGALGAPGGLAFDGQGRLVISDVARNQLKLLPKALLGLQ